MADLGNYKAAWERLQKLNELNEVDRPTLQRHIKEHFRPWRDAFRDLVKEEEIAPAEGSLTRFFEGIGTAVGRAQTLLDRRSLDFSRGRQSRGLPPAFFQIPRVEAELRFAIVDSSEEGFGVFAHPEDEDSETNEQTVRFEIAAVPPNPRDTQNVEGAEGDASNASETLCRLVAGDERETILRAAREDRYASAADHAILREQSDNGTLLVIEVFAPGSYLLLRGDETKYPDVSALSHQAWFFLPEKNKLERLTERVTAGERIGARSLKRLASRQRSFLLERREQKVDLYAFKDAYSKMQPLAGGEDTIDADGLRQYVPLYERMREELLYLARLLDISPGNDDAGELFSQVGQAAIRAQDALDRNRAADGGGFVIPRIQADFKFQVDSVDEEGVGVLFYKRKNISKTKHQQSVAFEVVPMGVTPELQAELDRDPDHAAEVRDRIQRLLPCYILDGGDERRRIRTTLESAAFDEIPGIEKLRDARRFERTVILELIRPAHYLLMCSGDPGAFALWYLDRNGPPADPWRLESLPADASALNFAEALDAVAQTRKA